MWARGCSALGLIFALHHLPCYGWSTTARYAQPLHSYRVCDIEAGDKCVCVCVNYDACEVLRRVLAFRVHGVRVTTVVGASQRAFDMRRHGNSSAPQHLMQARSKSVCGRHLVFGVPFEPADWPKTGCDHGGRRCRKNEKCVCVCGACVLAGARAGPLVTNEVWDISTIVVPLTMRHRAQLFRGLVFPDRCGEMLRRRHRC